MKTPRRSQLTHKTSVAAARQFPPRPLNETGMVPVEQIVVMLAVVQVSAFFYLIVIQALQGVLTWRVLLFDLLGFGAMDVLLGVVCWLVYRSDSVTDTVDVDLGASLDKHIEQSVQHHHHPRDERGGLP